MSLLLHLKPVASAPRTSITFTINNKTYSITDVDPTLSLNDFIRTKTTLTGTKHSCGQGGCGVCTVVASFVGIDGKTKYISLNSCLRPIAACDGMHITTTEGLGCSTKGYHPIQERISDYSATQCGFCTPGFVMTMAEVLFNNPSPPSEVVEKAMASNLCRCTGYRSILEAMKSFCPDFQPLPPCRQKELSPHLESLELCKGPVPKDKIFGPNVIPLRQVRPPPFYSANGVSWYTPSTLQELDQLIVSNPSASLIVGNTSQGIYRTNQQVLIDIRYIPELALSYIHTTGVLIGAATTITDFIELLQKAVQSSNPVGFPQLIEVLNHIAHPSVKNVGSVGGNLMMCHQHQTSPNAFQSDVTTALMTLQAQLLITTASTKQSDTLSVEDFLNINMTGRYIQSIYIPYPTSTSIYRAYRTSSRRVNAYSLGSAGMWVDRSGTTVTNAVIVIGCMGARPTRMKATEAQMKGISCTNEAAFHNLFPTLLKEVPIPNDSHATYRKNLACSFLYKFFLNLQPNLSSRLQRAALSWLPRDLSNGSQAFQPHPENYPVGQAVPKIEAKQQASGELQYIDDIPVPGGAVFAAFVTATQANCSVVSIDPSAALAMPGVSGFLSAKDIESPYVNSWSVDADGAGVVSNRPIFADTLVSYYGQPVGMVLADTWTNALIAASLVKVTYSNQTAPIIVSVDEAIAAKSFWNIQGLTTIHVGDPENVIKTCANVIQGSVTVPHQIHFHLEPQSCLAVPKDQCAIDLYSATQLPGPISATVANTLGTSVSKVNVIVARCGGGYGGKLTNSALPACASALAAKMLKRPVKLIMPFSENNAILGKRHEMRCDYSVGTDANGKLKAILMEVYANGGYGFSDGLGSIMSFVYNVDNCYNCPNWSVQTHMCKTNLPPNTAMRGPGWVPAIFVMEHVMNHMARVIKMDEVNFRTLNLYKPGDFTPSGDQLLTWTIPDILSQLYQSADYQKRVADVTAFNQSNLWNKRHLSVVPAKFGVQYNPGLSVLVNIYPDGTVNLTHGGSEIGQGINTKAVQMCAHALGCDMSFISVTPTNTFVNNAPYELTGGSTTSELVCLGVMNACQELNKRLDPFRKSGQKWLDLVTAAIGANIHLSYKGYSGAPPPPQGKFNYASYLGCCTEVEVDILTGETNIVRADIVFDCGYSLSPLVDIGQIEGGFVQGLGYYMFEDLHWDSNGKCLTANTWDLKPPSALDIPATMNLTLLANNPNKYGVMSSKATGEPPLLASGSGLFACEGAIQYSLQERGKLPAGSYVGINPPSVPPTVQTLAAVETSEFVFN